MRFVCGFFLIIFSILIKIHLFEKEVLKNDIRNQLISVLNQKIFLKKNIKS